MSLRKGLYPQSYDLWMRFRPLGEGSGFFGAVFFFPGSRDVPIPWVKQRNLHATFQLPIYGVLVLDDPI